MSCVELRGGTCCAIKKITSNMVFMLAVLMYDIKKIFVSIKFKY